MTNWFIPVLIMMIALNSDDFVFAAVGGICLGILLAVFDDWFKRRQRRKRRNRARHQ